MTQNTNKKTELSISKTTNGIGKLATIAIIGYMVFLGFQIPTPKQNAKAGEITKNAVSEIVEIKSNIEKPKEVVVEAVEAVVDNKTVVAEVKVNPVATFQSKYLAKWFNDKTGQMHWDICRSKPVGIKFTDAFAEFGADAQVIACVTLNYENGQVSGNYITDAVSPCWSTNAQQAVARKCAYASDNSNGVDAGLFMINTYFQAKRITKLGGQGLACNFEDSRNPSDSCNQKKIGWLHNIDNQIAIIKDIYREQGFKPWVAYNKHVAPFL